MKKHLHFALLLGMIAVLMANCSIYHPQSVDIPLINHSGDTRVDASLGLSFWLVPSTFTLNTTVSHGFNNWFSGQLHANYGGNNFYLQAAPGIYKSLGEKTVLEGFAGIGYGGAWSEKVKASTSNSTNNYAYDGTFILSFAQANFGWHDLTAANIDLGLGLKLGAYMPNFNYRELNSEGNTIDGSEYNYTTTNFLIEPQLMLRIGPEHFKFNVRLGFCWLNDLFGESSTAHNLYSDIFSTSAGFTFSF